MGKAVMKFYIKPEDETNNYHTTYIAVKPYNGKNIKGRAKCAVSNQFDNDFGRELAAYIAVKEMLLYS